MAALRRVVLTCNADGCLHSYQGELGYGVPSINLARNQAREKGWRTFRKEGRRRVDYCNDHVAHGIDLLPDPGAELGVG